MWRKGNRSSLYSSLWTIWRSKRKTNSIFIVWLNAPQSGGAPYSRSRWSSFTNGNGTDSTSSRLYTGNQTLRFIIYLLFSIVIILFILFYFISVSTYQKYKCVEITECKLYMCVDDTKITRGTIQCLWHEEYRIQKRGNVQTLSWSDKSPVFRMESALTSHGSSKSNKKPSDGREISE